MSRAYRLIVVWMAGALGTLAVYGTHRLQIAEVATVPPAPVPLTPVDDARAAIVKYLKVRFDEVEYRDDGYAIKGLAYLAGEGLLVEVHEPALTRFLPDTRFFTTKLAAPSLEYPAVRTLVSFRRTVRGDDIRSCVAIDFTKPSAKFLSQFTDLPVPTRQSQQELALALADLLARTVHRGIARLADHSVNGVVAEIWDGRLHWRNLQLIVSWNGHVDSIILSNPISHGVELVVTNWRLP